MSTTIRNISFSLDAASIDEAIREILDVESRLKGAFEKLINSLTQQGATIAKAQLVMFERPAWDSGALQDSIVSVPYDGSAGYVATDCPYSIYVEFGTGPRGAGSPHPLGGGYRSTGWKYYNERIGHVVFTYGMGSRPFMYNTYRQLEEEARTKGGKVIAQYLAG